MIAYEKFGNGPIKIIGLHGWFGDENTFKPLELSLDPDEVECIWLAHRGYGKSKAEVGQYTMEEMANDAVSVADKLGWAEFNVMGHSMGGKAAQIIASKHPNRVKKMIAVAPISSSAVPFDDETRSVFDSVATVLDVRRRVITDLVNGRLTQAWVNGLSDASMTASTIEATEGYLRSWADDDYSELVNGCKTDTIVYYGEHDPIVTLAGCELAFSDKFNNLKIVEIKNSAHYPVDEVPLNLGAEIRSFLNH